MTRSPTEMGGNDCSTARRDPAMTPSRSRKIAGLLTVADALLESVPEGTFARPGVGFVPCVLGADVPKAFRCRPSPEAPASDLVAQDLSEVEGCSRRTRLEGIPGEQQHAVVDETVR